jgi:hypothetical protein
MPDNVSGGFASVEAGEEVPYLATGSTTTDSTVPPFPGLDD